MFAPSKIVHVATHDLIPNPKNPRTHSKKQIRKVARSIQQFGFVSPILVDGTNTIIAGHCRMAAAKALGLPEVPTIVLDRLSPEEVRAYLIADNKLASLAGWDQELLANELVEIAAAVPDFDLTVTGFEVDEIEILHDLVSAHEHGGEEPPAIQNSTKPAVTRLGDHWKIGGHRLLCGDACDASSYRQLLGREKADLVVTDPPYNVPISGHVSGLGAVRHSEFCMASGEMSRAEFLRFLTEVCSNLAKFSRSGSLHYIFMDWRSIATLLEAGEQSYDDLLNLIVWVKDNAGMGSMYRSRHELLAVFKQGKRPHVNNIALGRNGRYRTNVWEYPGVNSFGAARSKELALHPTVKNLDMITEAIKDASRLNALVLDPFGGSGTTLLAAERARRVSRLIELDPKYCDAIVKRSATLSLEISLVESGETFEQVKLRREREFVPDQGEPSDV